MVNLLFDVKHLFRLTLVAAIILGIINMLLHVRKNTNHQNSPRQTGLSGSDSSRLPFCKNILDEIRNGTWKQKDFIGRKDFEKRFKMDEFLRVHRGQPRYLHRSDLRCGTNFELRSPGFEAAIPSMCMRSSKDYCCNSDGFCGHGKLNCSCSKCVDFRKIISAELHNWLPHGCKMRNYTSISSCTVVEERLSHLVLIGDSLMRHLFSALMLVFTGDYNRGALRDKHPNHCTGERQFVDRGKANCHFYAATNSSEKKNFCDGKNFTFTLYKLWKISMKKKILGAVRQQLGKTSVIVMGLGLHDSLDDKAILKELIDPILDIIGQNIWPRLIWVTTHAQGYLKPSVYRRVQNNENILRFNDVMRAGLSERGIPVLDVFNMTKGVYSYDGTHYGYGVNMVKAQFLLNYIHQTIRT